MKVKLLLMLFLISLCLSAFALEKREKRAQLHIIHNKKRTTIRRLPSLPLAYVEDMNDCLYITFQRSLKNVDFIITDKNGNEVVNEQQTFIYEGRVIVIPQSDDYPYSIEITSPTVEIQGEIVLE